MDRIKDVLVNPRHAKWLGPVLVALDAVLCGLIILKVPCKQSLSRGLDRRLADIFARYRD